MLVRLFYVFLMSLTTTIYGVAQGGILLAPGVSWNNFVFEPVAHENTPNYYGYGGHLSLGYSVMQVLDFAAYGEYVPGQLNAAELGKEGARIYSYGGELAFRIGQALYIGGRGGSAGYSLIQRTYPEEVGGRWTGVGGGVSLGLIIPTSRMNMWQATLDFGQMTVRPVETPTDPARRISHISLKLAFVYNSLHISRLDNAIYNNLLKGIF